MKNNEKSIKKIEKYSTLIKEKAENVKLTATIAGISIASSSIFGTLALIAFRDNDSVYKKIILTSVAALTGIFSALAFKSSSSELKRLKNYTNNLEIKAKNSHSVQLLLKKENTNK